MVKYVTFNELEELIAGEKGYLVRALPHAGARI